MKNVNNCLKIVAFLSLLSMVMLLLSSCFCAHEWEYNEILKEATCLEEGRADATCKLCGVTQEVVLPKGEHQGKVVVTSTCTEDGYTVIDCPVCGHYEKYNIIPARGHKTEGNSVFCSRCDVVTSCENYFIELMKTTEQDTLHFRVQSLPVSESVYLIALEMRLGRNAEGVLVGEGFANMKGGLDGVDVDAYVYDDTLYLYDKTSQGYQVIPLSLILENLTTEVPQPPVTDGSANASVTFVELETFFEEEFRPLLKAVNTLTDEKVNLAISHIVSSLFEVARSESNYYFHLSNFRLKELNERLSKESVSFFIDKEFGRGTFDYIEGIVTGMLTRTVGETIADALADGVTVEELVGKLDALAVLLTGSEDMTFTDILSGVMGEDFDLLALLQDEELMRTTVADLLARYGEEPTTGEALLREVRTSFADMREKTVYALCGVAEGEFRNTREEIDATIDAYLDLFSFSFAGTPEGKLLSVSVGLPMGASYPTTFTLFLSESETPDVGEVPDTVASMLSSLKVENGTVVENEKNETGGVNRTVRTRVEFVSLADGTVTAIRTHLSVVTFEFSGKTEEVIYNGTEQTAWLYDAVEEIFVIEFLMGSDMEMYIRDDCCGWMQFALYQTSLIEYTKNTFVISWIGKDYVYGDVLTSETTQTLANNTVGFWYNENTGEVRIDNDFETHEYVYEREVIGASCREECYEVWGCPDCEKEEKRNVTRGPHTPEEGRPYCSLCSGVTYNPDDALYIYDSETDDIYVEIFASGDAVAFMELDGSKKIYETRWKEENGQIVLYFSWNNQTVLTLNLVDGELVAPV